MISKVLGQPKKDDYKNVFLHFFVVCSWGVNYKKVKSVFGDGLNGESKLQTSSIILMMVIK
ncbi:hypothetical protein D0S45_15505 [Marinifilum sp. JC120]|nr:hypothetical protein D0S45_15505 [Marinifilum sp. JC120]